MKITHLLLIVPILFLLSCDNGTNKNIFLDGRILNSQELGSIIVEILEGNSTRDSTDVDENGDFNLNFNSSTGIVRLRFITDSFTAERQNFSVTDDSTIDLSVTINQNPVSIVFNSWVVLQERISTNDNDVIVFIETQADIIINGDNNTCIRTRGSSVVEFQAKSIDLSNCDEGLRAENSSEIILLADEEISIFSDSNGIRSKNESMVSLGQTLNPVNNSVEVRSFNADGVNTSETSEVVFTPQNNNCTIQGANNAVNEGSNSTVDTDGCTLVDG